MYNMKTLQRIVSLSFCLIIFLNASAQPLVDSRNKKVYDANAQARPVGNFSSIDVGGSIKLYISTGNEDAVAVSTKDASVLADVVTEVKNGELHIGMRSGHRSHSSGDVKAYVSVKTLNRLTASGASEVIVNDALQANDLSITISGASDFKGEVRSQNLRLNASGSSDYTISGKTVNLKIDLSGASDVKGFDLSADNCDIDGSGASDVKITVNKEIKANLSGACDVAYRGNAATRDIRTSGSSSVKKAGSKD
jgi:type 1 fimbria pilin